MYKAIVGEESFEILFDSNENNKGKINGDAFELDLVQANSKELHIIKDNQSFNVELISHDTDKNSMRISVNGKRYDVDLKDKYSLLLDKLGIDLNVTKKVNELKAPMPGLVFRIDVKAGDTVEEGQPLLILEAMKMENMIKSPTTGVIASIDVTEGVAVEKNEILIHFE